MRINELTMPATRRDAEKIMYNAGYQKRGTGSFCTVFQKSNRPYVLKLFSSIDRAYIDFIGMTIQNPNPHFPKVVGRMIKITGSYSAIRLEPLKKCAGTSATEEFLFACQEYLDMHGKEIRVLPNALRLIAMQSRKWMDNHPTVKEACDLIANLR